MKNSYTNKLSYCLLFLWIFGLMASSMDKKSFLYGSLNTFDVSFFEWTKSFVGNSVYGVAVFFTRLGDAEFIVFGAICASIIAIIAGRIFLVPIFAGSLFITKSFVYTLKHSIMRIRPEGLFYPVNGADSFPSGHATMGMLWYGLLAYVLWRGIKNKWFRIIHLKIFTFVAIAVGVSRLFLGVHWFSDVVGGWLIATGVLFFVAWLFSAYPILFGKIIYNEKYKNIRTALLAIITIIFVVGCVWYAVPSAFPKSPTAPYHIT